MSANRELEIQVVVSELFAENAYIVRLPERDDCLVIDPGFDSHQILQRLEQSELRLAAILNTHGHADHIAGNEALLSAHPDCPLVIGSGDADKLTDPVGNLSAPFGMPIVSPPATATVDALDEIEYAGISLQVLETPGHSCGHVVFVYRGASPFTVLGGDVLFREGVGRTDFPDSDTDQLVASIREQLYTLPPDTVILPGHGPSTTVGHEQQHNPFVR